MLRLIDQSEMFRTASHAPKAAVPKNSNTPEQGLSGEHKLGPGSCGAKFLWGELLVETEKVNVTYVRMGHPYSWLIRSSILPEEPLTANC